MPALRHLVPAAFLSLPADSPPETLRPCLCSGKVLHLQQRRLVVLSVSVCVLAP